MVCHTKFCGSSVNSSLSWVDSNNQYMTCYIRVWISKKQFANSGRLPLGLGCP